MVHRWWLTAQVDQKTWVEAGASIDLGMNDIPKRGERRVAFIEGLKADVAGACGCLMGRVKSVVIGEGSPRYVTFKFGNKNLPGDRSAKDLLGVYMSQVMDSSSSLYKGVVTSHLDRQQTMRQLGHDFFGSKGAGGKIISHDASAESPSASMAQAKARRKAADMLSKPPPQQQGTPPSVSKAKNVLFAAADLAAMEHARLTSISMGIKQYTKIMGLYERTAVLHMVSRWTIGNKMYQAHEREQALLKLNAETGANETKLMETLEARDTEINTLKATLAASQNTVQEQQAKLAENALVMLERAELQSELKSTAAGGAELVGDITTKLADVVMALQSQGVLFNNKLKVAGEKESP